MRQSDLEGPPHIPTMKRLPLEMKTAVALSIRNGHPEILSLIENDILRIVAETEFGRGKGLGASLMLFNKICQDEFEHLSRELYILGEVFQVLVTEIDAGRMEAWTERIDKARRMAVGR